MQIEAEALRALSEKASEGNLTAAEWSSDMRIGRYTVGMINPQGDGNGLNDRAFLVALWNEFRAGRLIDIAFLKSPVAIHINMLAGTIAKPSVEQILHLYPDLIHRSALSEETARAAEGAEALENAKKALQAILDGVGCQPDYINYAGIRRAQAAIAEINRALPPTTEAGR